MIVSIHELELEFGVTYSSVYYVENQMKLVIIYSMHALIHSLFGLYCVGVSSEEQLRLTGVTLSNLWFITAVQNWITPC